MKTTFTYDSYWTYETLKSNIFKLKELFAKLVSVESICTTPEGRNIFALTITSPASDPLKKPAFYVDGGTHAGEVTGTMAAMHTADYLLTNYGSDDGVTKLLDQMTVYVIPRVSPDGAETYLTTPYSIRSADRVYKPEAGGIYEKDLDGDDVVRMMRIKTPYGAWKIDPQDGSTMTLRKPDDTEGTFYDIFTEGMLESFDGDENLKMKKKDWALDFNRNYPFGWFPDGRQPGAGPYPLYNPETHAMVDFILAHPNICCVSTNHTSGGLILYPPGTKPSTKAHPEDIDLLKTLAEMGQEATGYVPLNIFDSFIHDQENYDSGAFDDWCFQNEGIPAYTVELWDLDSKVGVPRNWGGQKEDMKTVLKRFNACMKWVKEHAPQYYKDWTPVDHPQFKEVEVGGFNWKFTIQNPPEDMLLSVLEPMTKFMISLAKAAPHLAIDSFTAKKVKDGVYEVEAIIGNHGYMNTSLTESAKDLKKDTPVKVDLSGGTILSPQTSFDIPELQGYGSSKTFMSFYGNLTTQAAARAKKKVTWIVLAAEGTKLELSVSNAKAGCATASIVL